MTLIDDLLVGQDVFHDQIFVFLPNRLVQLLLVLADQLLDVHVVLLRLQGLLLLLAQVLVARVAVRLVWNAWCSVCMR